MNSIYDLGIQLIQALQTLSPALDTPMKFFTFLGTIEFYLIFIPLLYWVVDVQLGMRALLVLVSTDFLSASFKQLLHEPRPYWFGTVKQLGTDGSYGIPSSHSSDSLAVWGTLAYRLKRNWMWVVSILLVLLISFSRLYLGVHFPQDVLAGWLIGLVVVFIFARAEKRFMAWFCGFSDTGQIAIGFVISMIMLLIGKLILRMIAPISDPAAWAQFATEGRSPFQYITLSGALFGAIAGFVLMWRHARFQVKGAWWQRVGRYLLGIVGMLVFYLGLDMLFGLIAADATLVGYILRYIRYGMVTFWFAFGAPWVFLKLKLAQPAG
jgi:membrane-associated phospholipid phosphatase